LTTCWPRPMKVITSHEPALFAQGYTGFHRKRERDLLPRKRAGIFSRQIEPGSIKTLRLN
jgi:hypothetical protein